MATSNRESAGRKSRGTKGRTGALTLLEADHLIVAGLFEEYENSKDDEALKTEFAKQICRALTVHGTIEEEIFYPAAAEALEEDEEMEEAIDQAGTDHGSIDDLVAEIEEALAMARSMMPSTIASRGWANSCNSMLRKRKPRFFPR